jgi:hypothetical protein
MLKSFNAKYEAVLTGLLVVDSIFDRNGNLTFSGFRESSTIDCSHEAGRMVESCKQG